MLIPHHTSLSVADWAQLAGGLVFGGLRSLSIDRLWPSKETDRQLHGTQRHGTLPRAVVEGTGCVTE